MWPLLEKVLRGADKKVYPFVFGWNTIQMSIKGKWDVTSVRSFFFFINFCLVVLSIGENGVLRSPTMSVSIFMWALIFGSTCFINVGAFVFVTLMFRIETLYWWITPVVNMKWTSSSLLIDFGLTSNFLDIRIATPACFLGIFDWKIFYQPFTLSLKFRCVPCMQQNDGFGLRIHSVSLCLLRGK